jgi:hypothetical protein
LLGDSEVTESSMTPKEATCDSCAAIVISLKTGCKRKDRDVFKDGTREGYVVDLRFNE